jgi:hypothetical protein
VETPRRVQPAICLTWILLSITVAKGLRRNEVEIGLQ